MASDALKANRRLPLWLRRLMVSARRANIFAFIEIAAVITFVVMTAVTWTTLAGSPEENELLPTRMTTTLLVGTLVPALAILVLLGRRMALKRAQENEAGTGRMHVRLVFIFSLIAAVPTLFVVAFASALFQFGVEFWFSDQSRGLLENANKLARGYYEQNLLDVGNETEAMSVQLREFLSENSTTSESFSEGFMIQTVNRRLNKASIIQVQGEEQALIAAFPANDPIRKQIAPDAIRQLADSEDPVVTRNAAGIEAVAPIDRELGVYLYTVRSSDLLEFSQSERAQNIVQDYEVLTRRARILQLRTNVALFALALLLVALSIWFALRYADRQVKPLYELVGAARRVGAGNYSLRVEGRTGADEVGLLNRAFNRMTDQIERQTTALVGANEELHERGVFIETVLGSVTAGVISLDEEGRVQLMNSSALDLLGFDEMPVGEKMADIAPAFANLDHTRSGQIVQHEKGGDLLTLAVKSTRTDDYEVITFEDITRQILDQRQAAWSDVARRIAHEIKNPLTPIQLATERLKRRYRKQIEQDGELFDELTRTIVRQVGELRTMVDAFSSFARLPKPAFRREDPVDLAKQALFLQEVGHPEIDYRLTVEGEIDAIQCDRHQFGQAMTNVLKNAAEAIDALAGPAEPDFRGRIDVSISGEGELVRILIEDNGIGLPKEREKIVEPYVTTRERGTGLGLAIVNKIVEEHGGAMTFGPREQGGTRVTLTFARDPRVETHDPNTREAAE
ncbi:sensor histidine kinase [Blastomonas marina]|nr:ATP-binding protein [Blastomonas marina]